MSTAIVVLAAGGSTRLGQAKQLIRIGGTSLLYHAVQAAKDSLADNTCVVLGYEAERMKRELDGLDVTCVLNDRWQEGIASSIRSGVNALPYATEGVLLMLCDQPRVSSSLLDAILTRHRSAPGAIIASSYAETMGVPAFFPSPFFGELLSLKGDKGAKQIIELHRPDTLTVPFPGGTIDIDTRDDLERIHA